MYNPWTKYLWDIMILEELDISGTKGAIMI